MIKQIIFFLKRKKKKQNLTRTWRLIKMCGMALRLASKFLEKKNNSV